MSEEITLTSNEIGRVSCCIGDRERITGLGATQAEAVANLRSGLLTEGGKKWPKPSSMPYYWAAGKIEFGNFKIEVTK